MYRIPSMKILRFLPLVGFSSLAATAGCRVYASTPPVEAVAYQPAPPPPPQPAPAPVEAEVVYESAPPPPPPVEVEVVPAAPGPEYFWIGGYHRWEGHRYVWVRGHYERRPHPRAHWEPAHWEAHARGHVWIEGRWR
jgi:hypothetical protein